MTDRDDRGRPSRPPAEGVRIIGAEEAQAALEAGEAAGRRPDDQLRFGDVPPAPAGPRPAHRFPLPESVDPARAVSLPPLAPSARPAGREALDDYPEPEQFVEPEQRPPTAEREDLGWEPSASQEPAPPAVPTSPPAWTEPVTPEPRGARPARPEPRPAWGSADAFRPAAATPAVDEDSTTEMGVPAEGITVSGSVPEMPHWTDPPTGEVPKLRIDDEREPEGDDLAAWRALGQRGARWRDEDDWDDADELDDLLEAAEPVGALDTTRAEHSDLYSFDEDFERVTSRTGSHPVVDYDEEDDYDDYEPEDYAPPARRSRTKRGAGRWSAVRSRVAPAGPDREEVAVTEPAAVGSSVRAAAGDTVTPGRRIGSRPSGAGSAGRAPATAGDDGGDTTNRIAIGVGLIVVLAIAYLIGPKALLVFAAVVVVACAAEAYKMVYNAGFRPATLLGLIASGGVVLGAYWKGIAALPVLTVLMMAGAMLWYVLGIVEGRPLANASVSVMVFTWVGLLGSFAGVLLSMRHGKGLFLGAIVTAVAADVLAFAVGRAIGSRPMARSISPNKTLEGFLGGVAGAVIVGAIIGKEVTPWAGMKHGLLLGLVVGLVAPAGDLFESMIKRDLGLKDSGRLLGSHGGLLDRFDGLLVALPAAYFVATFFRL